MTQVDHHSWNNSNIAFEGWTKDTSTRWFFAVPCLSPILWGHQQPLSSGHVFTIPKKATFSQNCPVLWTTLNHLKQSWVTLNKSMWLIFLTRGVTFKRGVGGGSRLTSHQRPGHGWHIPPVGPQDPDAWSWHVEASTTKSSSKSRCGVGSTRERHFKKGRVPWSGQR